MHCENANGQFSKDEVTATRTLQSRFNALNRDASFSAQEAGAAKAELNRRTRSILVNAFGGDGIKASSLALLQQYSKMSHEERSVLGFTEAYANRIVASYRSAASIQSSLGSGSGGGLAAYF